MRKMWESGKSPARELGKRLPFERRRRSSKGENTRTRILDKAAQLFSERGYADVGMNQLATTCRLSKGALFTHFKSKRHIYVESVRRVYAQTLDEYQESSAAKTPRARLRHYLNWLCSAMAQNRLMCRLALRMVLDHDTALARELLPGSFGRTHDKISKLIHDVHPRKDSRILGFFLYAIFMVNDEMLEFADVWTPSTAKLVGGRKSAQYLEKLILAW